MQNTDIADEIMDYFEILGIPLSEEEVNKDIHHQQSQRYAWYVICSGWFFIQNNLDRFKGWGLDLDHLNPGFGPFWGSEHGFGQFLDLALDLVLNLRVGDWNWGIWTLDLGNGGHGFGQFLGVQDLIWPLILGLGTGIVASEHLIWVISGSHAWISVISSELHLEQCRLAVIAGFWPTGP